jgi:acyl transferase domain-containing protein
LEVGPGNTLSTLVKRHPAKSVRQVVLTSLPRAREGQSEQEHVLQVLGQLWLAGVEIDWQGFYAGERRRRLPLPTYPFERQSYWIGTDETAQLPAAQRPMVEESPANDDAGASAGGKESSAPVAVQVQTDAALTQPEPPSPVVSLVLSGSLPATALPAVSNGTGRAKSNISMREQMVTQQIEIMRQQLELMRRRR